MKTAEKRYPPREPYAPCEPKREHYNMFGATEQQIIYRDVELIGDCGMDLEEHFADMEEELPQPELGYNQMTLQDIVNLAPPGAKLSDISLKISYPRMAEYLDVEYIYTKRDVEAEEQAYLRAKKKYEEDYANYLVDMEKFNKELEEFQAWQKEQEIKQLQHRIAELRR